MCYGNVFQRAQEALFDKYFDKHKIVDLIQNVFRKQEKKVFTMKRELEYLETYMQDQYDNNLQKASATNKLSEVNHLRFFTQWMDMWPVN